MSLNMFSNLLRSSMMLEYMNRTTRASFILKRACVTLIRYVYFSVHIVRQ